MWRGCGAGGGETGRKARGAQAAAALFGKEKTSLVVHLRINNSKFTVIYVNLLLFISGTFRSLAVHLRYQQAINSHWLRYQQAINSQWLRYQQAINSHWLRYQQAINSHWLRYQQAHFY